MIKDCREWICYCLPLAITGLFVSCLLLDQVLLFLIMLVMLNFLNKPSGEFAVTDLRSVLTQFESCPKIKIVKFVSAFAFLLLNIWILIFVSSEPRSLSWLLLSATSFAIINCTFTMAIGHELLHMRTSLSRPLANALLFTVGLPFFTNDHLFGHHKFVGTETDKSSASLNQSFYNYLPAVIAYRIRKSFFSSNTRIEQLVIKENRILLLFNISLVILIATLSQNSKLVLLFFALQCLFSFLLFELSNYVQHYGLQRKSGEDGKPEAIGFNHSWNYYFKYTNYLTYLVPLHSYHHLQLTELPKHLPNGPTLPYSYFKMMVLALIPPLWFNKMNPLCVIYTAR